MISIIVPVYNIENYLPRCMDSLFAQTDSDFEIILVDDGSTDGSGSLCDQYATRDTRVRVIHKENGGLSSARNAGLSVAKGAYILFLDGDDYLAPNAVRCLMGIVDATADFDFIQFHYAETDGGWQADPAQKANARVCTDLHEMFQYLYQHGGVAASACTKLYRASLFENLRFLEGITHEDEELITRLLPQCNRVIYTEFVLYGYVMRGGSIIHENFHPHKLDVLDIMDNRADALQKLGYEELVLETRSRQFRTAAMLYCQARRFGAAESARQLQARLKALSREHELLLSGQYWLLYHLTRLTKFAPELYYCIRRVCGKS